MTRVNLEGNGRWGLMPHGEREQQGRDLEKPAEQ